MADSGEDEREEELISLAAIYPELVVNEQNPFSVTLDLPVAPSKLLLVRFLPDSAHSNGSYANAVRARYAHIEHDLEFSHLPPLHLQLTLPKGYPANEPPEVGLSTQYNWLPKSKLEELEQDVAKLWEEYGHCQTAFVFIDFLQQAAENGFHLDQAPEGLLVLPLSQKEPLVEFDTQTKVAKFRDGTYDCGICLEPKKGSVCHKMERCGHVFCLQCLHDFYNNAISEGDVANVSCLDPACGKDGNRKRKHKRPIHPRELLAIGIAEDVVRRFVEMKRKKQIESDKNTVFCPRTWCQSPARSSKYPPIPNDLASYIIAEELSDGEAGVESTTTKGDSPRADKKKLAVPADPADRLAVCEKCSFAFCRVCYMGWHGQYQRCHPRDPNELSAEEKASYDYILRNTTPCPTCGSPTQKTHGCNHMQCFQCSHHFCYLCSSWLDAQNPYRHFNTPGRECYQRLFELDEGDEGQGPADGRGFGGGRRYEQMALEVAREADAQEAAQIAAAQAQLEENDVAGDAHAIAGVPQGPRHVLPDLAALRLADNQLAGRFRGREDRAPAVRGPAANPLPGGGGRGGARPAFQHDEEIQRFVRLAEMDEEDGWDSDELGDDDERFVIR